MNFKEFKIMTAMPRVLFLRTMAIIIQLCAVLSLYAVIPSDIAIKPLLTVIAIEAIFHGLSVWWYKRYACSPLAITAQIIADIVFLTLLMSFSGGATNAFVSLLLMPIVIGAVSLPTRLLTLVSLFAVASYSALLLSLPINNHHMDMTNHFIGMWVNFLLSVIVVTLVVGTMSKMITNRERAIAKQREEQLKSEQLISLGVASAQVTHQLATPLANLQLLFEEINEQYPQDEAVCAMEQPLEKCRHELHRFRELATSIRENKTSHMTADTLLNQLKIAVNLQFPHVETVIKGDERANTSLITSDAMLLPALCNLVQNAVHANMTTHSNTVELALIIEQDRAILTIRDHGHGIKPSLNNLGDELVKSKNGLGMALMLSSSSIERLGGTLSLTNHAQGGALATVTLPLVELTEDDLS